MRNSILACKIDGKDIYFIKRPDDPRQDGFIRTETEDIPIDFWSYVSRATNIEPVRFNDYLKKMWDGDTRSLEWVQEYLNHGQKPVK